MDKIKSLNSQVIRIFILLLFLVYPFGQLIRIDLGYLRVQPIDVFVGIIVILGVVKYNLLNKIEGFGSFLMLVLFSYVFSLIYFGFTSFVGFAYLVRLISYILLFELALLPEFRTVLKKADIKLSVFYITITVLVSAFLQYIFFPDLRFLSALGWDDHYGRMAGSYLDPGFAGIIFTLIHLYFLYKFQNNKSFSSSLVIILSSAAVLLTFSRAAYLAYISGSLFYLYTKINWKKIFFGLLIFIVTIPFLPRFSSEGTNLLRTYSIQARINSYKQTLQVFSDSPALGIGYNNLCEYKIRFLSESSFYSHACSGADSSLLMLMATTGISGLIAFIYSLKKYGEKLRKDKKTPTIYASGLAVIVHSFFTNSLIYPWVVIWLILLLLDSFVLGSEVEG